MCRGEPAIQPRGNAVPAFTEQDVRGYLSRHVPLRKVIPLSRPTVAQVVLATIRELGRATDNSAFEANYPADMLNMGTPSRATQA